MRFRNVPEQVDAERLENMLLRAENARILSLLAGTAEVPEETDSDSDAATEAEPPAEPPSAPAPAPLNEQPLAEVAQAPSPPSEHDTAVEKRLERVKAVSLSPSLSLSLSLSLHRA